jgi:ABC-2 type transport system permease protein
VRKVWAIIRREFIERVRTKAFWIGTILGPLLLFGMFAIQILLATRQGEIRRIVVVDATTGGVGDRVRDALDSARGFAPTRIPSGEGVVDSLTGEVGAKRLDGFLLISDSLADQGTAEYRASNVSSFTTRESIERALRTVVLQVRLERAGVDPDVVEQAQIRVNLATKKISGTTTTGESAGQSFALAYVMALILYMAIMLYGASIMNSVLEEKTTRVVEVLVSSLTPGQLMAGKLLGVGAVSMLQLLIWVVSAKAMMLQSATMTAGAPGGSFSLPAVPLTTLAIFLFYFVGGFLLYSAMFAAVGAISSNTQEAQQGAQPVIMLLVVALISMFGMINDPTATYAVVLSLVPFTAPIATPVRWVAGSVPLIELLASMVLLLAAIYGVTWVAARIYRVGILMTGKRPSLKELFRWARTG